MNNCDWNGAGWYAIESTGYGVQKHEPQWIDDVEDFDELCHWAGEWNYYSDHEFDFRYVVYLGDDDEPRTGGAAVKKGGAMKKRGYERCCRSSMKKVWAAEKMSGFVQFDPYSIPAPYDFELWPLSSVTDWYEDFEEPWYYSDGSVEIAIEKEPNGRWHWRICLMYWTDDPNDFIWAESAYGEETDEDAYRNLRGELVNGIPLSRWHWGLE